MNRQFSHYFKPVPEGVTHIDIYLLLKMFEVSDQAIGHAVKKLLCAGQRGAKDQLKDLREAIVSIERAIEISTPAPTEPSKAEVAIGNPPFQAEPKNTTVMKNFRNADGFINLMSHTDPLGQVEWIDDGALVTWPGERLCVLHPNTAVKVIIADGGDDWIPRYGLAGYFDWSKVSGYVVLRKARDPREENDAIKA